LLPKTPKPQLNKQLIFNLRMFDIFAKDLGPFRISN